MSTAVPYKLGMGRPRATRPEMPPDPSGAIWPARRVERARTIMEARGLRRDEAYPTGFAVLRRLGLHVRPPLFMTFDQLVMLGFALLCGLLGLGLKLALMAEGPIAAAASVGPDLWIAAVALAAILAPTFATTVRHRARRLELPRWEDL